MTNCIREPKYIENWTKDHILIDTPEAKNNPQAIAAVFKVLNDDKQWTVYNILQRNLQPLTLPEGLGTWALCADGKNIEYLAFKIDALLKNGYYNIYFKSIPDKTQGESQRITSYYFRCYQWGFSLDQTKDLDEREFQSWLLGEFYLHVWKG